MKKLAFVLLCLIYSGFLPVNAQKDLVREDFFDAEFFLADEDYAEALFSFTKVYNAGYQENANINYRMGICYLNIPGQKDKAAPYLEKAVKNISENYKEGNYNELTAPKDAWLYLGNAYRINYQLDKAIESYNSFINAVGKVNEVDIKYAEHEIEACQRAKDAMKNPSPIFKENLGKRYNTSANNFQVVYSGDENSMAYMTAQKFYDAVYFVKKINGAWSNPINITPQIESDGNQYVSSLSFDGTKLFLIQIDNFDGEILVSDYSMGRWNPSKSIGKPINSKFFESHASLSPDGKTLYFTSNRTGGIGGMDIYTSQLSETGSWSEPVNMGDKVNTPLNEETPFISSDGKTLYFSSQGHATIGGYDIFISRVQDDKSWSTPIALAYPINTTDDDLFFFPDDKKSGGYLTLYEEKGMGNGDLYYMKIILPGEELAETIPEELQAAAKEPEVVEEPVKVAPVEVTPPAEEVIVPVEEPAKGTQAEVTPPAKEVVVPIEEPQAPSFKYFIKPVFFGFDSYQLTDAAREKLNELSNALKEFPMLSLEVQGYTDATGPYEYNMLLSEKRAKSVTSYLVANGVDENRLKINAFSESGNIAINTFPDGRDAIEGRKFNRRVEFRIMELGGALLKIEEVPVPEPLRAK